jgi:hypothetical protein
MSNENTPNPHSIRLSDEDEEMLVYLRRRLGLKHTPVFRLALRKLYQQEKAMEAKETKQAK